MKKRTAMPQFLPARPGLLAIGLALLALPLFAQKPPFFDEIEALRKTDSLRPPATGGVLFIGSSSFTLWKDMGAAFPGFEVQNRAFGGSTLADQLRYFESVVVPCRLRQVVIYCGENDFALDEGLSVEEVAGRFRELYFLIKKHCGRRTRVAYVSMKPSPSRAHLVPKYAAANREIEAFLKKRRRTDFINVWPLMLGPDGRPRPELFVEDRLHMNATGYEIWKKAIAPVLLKT